MSPAPQNPDDYDSLAAQHVSLRRVLALFRPYRKRIATVIVLMLIASATGLAGPFLLRAIIDDALPRNDLKLLSLLVAGMILVALVSAIIGAWQVVLSSRIGQAVLHDLRVRLYAHLQNWTCPYLMERFCH
ncbi:ABC transporter transmembrane domain-containing protein [Brucella sp. H1_1004]|uniref:ABC transporter transmembrane domain-containing protein n=1 Tax=Brucella sp. H1_1004 TaxID=3110109 RepID=UPI0039B5D9C5